MVTKEKLEVSCGKSEKELKRLREEMLKQRLELEKDQNELRNIEDKGLKYLYGKKIDQHTKAINLYKKQINEEEKKLENCLLSVLRIKEEEIPEEKRKKQLTMKEFLDEDENEGKKYENGWSGMWNKIRDIRDGNYG